MAKYFAARMPKIALCLSVVFLSECSGINGSNMVPLDRNLVADSEARSTKNLIALVITPDLKSDALPRLCGVADVRLGPGLEHYSEQMLHTISSQVRITNSGDIIKEADYYVTPEMNKFAESFDAMISFTGDNMTMTMVLGWRVSDKNGKLLFLDTVIAHGHGALRGLATTIPPKCREMVVQTLTDGFQQSRAKLLPVLTATQ